MILSKSLVACGGAALLVIVASLIGNHANLKERLRQSQNTHRGLDDIVSNPDPLKAEYRVGVTYLQTMTVDHTSKMELRGQEAGPTVHLELGNELSISDVPIGEGHKEVILQYTRAAMTSKFMGATMKFDTNFPTEEQDQALAPLARLVGTNVTMVLDPDGTVVEASENEKLAKQLQGLAHVMDMGSYKNFEHMNRMNKALPGTTADPGDSWEFDLDVHSMLHYAGNGTLEGYSEYDGHNCSVVGLKGSFDIEAEGLIGGNRDKETDLKVNPMESMRIIRGELTCTMYFDRNEKFARWINVTESMIMKVRSPLATGFIEIPIEQVMLVTTEMKP